jgi:hypothetical protein
LFGQEIEEAIQAWTFLQNPIVYKNNEYCFLQPTPSSGN